jgi:hypothetical protein
MYMQKEGNVNLYKWEQFLSILFKTIGFIDVVLCCKLLGIGVALRVRQMIHQSPLLFHCRVLTNQIWL